MIYDTLQRSENSYVAGYSIHALPLFSVAVLVLIFSCRRLRL